MTKDALLNKKIVLPAAALLLAATAAFAYFTDRVDTTATVTTAENAVDVELNPGEDGDLSQQWETTNAEALANFNPGDKLDLGFDLKNTGGKAVDIRETFFITSSQALTEDSPEYRLFIESVQDAAGAWDGGEVASVELIGTNTIKYTVAPYVISSATEVIGNNPTEVSNTYDLVFNKAAKNAFQGSTCTVELLLEAKQHTEDGPEGGWTALESAKVEIGGQTVIAVPKK